MKRDEIIRMAREAGWNGIYSQPLMSIRMQEEDFLRFAALVVAAERQRIVNLLMEQHEMAKDIHNYWKVAAEWVQVGTDEEICK